ncbi:MAG: amidohydrolase [Spirochaetaceae bacterium]|nr:MAG: amidohydrolase [Spirochaetaceae bacterium]
MIDAHQHFWIYNDHDYVWMDETMAVLKQDHGPDRFMPLMDDTGVQGSIAVQARQMNRETDYLLDLASRHSWILGVVGWLDCTARDLAEQLERLSANPALKGFRELIHDMPDTDYADSPVHRNAVKLLGTLDLSYDLLLKPPYIPAAIRLVDSLPDQRFIVDHIGKPAISSGEMEPWRRSMIELARRPNVYCKLSGMVTEADWSAWKPADLKPYIEVCLEAFGARRLMIGSDWPVCTLAATYQDVMHATLESLAPLSESERAWITEDTCREAYRIERN